MALFDRDTEAQRGSVICPKSPRKSPLSPLRVWKHLLSPPPHPPMGASPGRCGPGWGQQPLAQSFQGLGLWCSGMEGWEMGSSWILTHPDALPNAPALLTSHTDSPASLRFPMAAWMLLSELALPIRDWRGPCSSVGVSSQKGKAGRQVEGEALTFHYPIPFPSFLPLTHRPSLTSSSPPSSTSLPSSRVKASMFQTGTSGGGASGICGVGGSGSGSGSGWRKRCWGIGTSS